MGISKILEKTMDIKTGALSNLNSSVQKLNKGTVKKKLQNPQSVPGLDARQTLPAKVRDKSAIVGITIDTTA